MQTRLIRLIAAATLTAGVLAAAPAQADPSPDEARTYLSQITAGQRGDLNLVFAGFFGFSQSDGTTAPPAGTRIHVSVTSCGQFVQQNDVVLDGTKSGVGVFFGPDNDPQNPDNVNPNPINAKVGTSFEYAIDITPPGYDTYTLTGSFNGYSVKRPTCEQILAGGAPDAGCKIDTKSKKVAVAGAGKRAVVGHQVKVSKTRAPGCKVTYKWTANGQKVGTGTSLFVGSRLKGKTLSVVVTVGKGQAKKTKVVSYGRVDAARG